jgi:hypothetical protein
MSSFGSIPMPGAIGALTIHYRDKYATVTNGKVTHIARRLIPRQYLSDTHLNGCSDS